jgi:hypothetical protein
MEVAIAIYNVQGPQSGTWTLPNSPYIVTGELPVQQGQTLIIEPGVYVKFLVPPPYTPLSFIIYNTLIAQGTPDLKIYFIPNATAPSFSIIPLCRMAVMVFT